VARGGRACAALAAAAAMALAASSSAVAQQSPSPSVVNPWADTFLSRRVADGAAPGVVVAILLDGTIVTLRGYGFADPERRVPMDPAATLIRLGGVTHIATAATALAAAESSIVRLQQDVHPLWERAKLTVQGPSTVTLQDLLTHSAGFGDRILGQFTPGKTELQPLVPYLNAAMPPLSLRPGTAVMPSAHALSLAGVTLEAASGQSLQELSRRLVFGPLAMDNTTFEPRVPPGVLSRMAVGHRWARDGLEAVPYDYAQTYPAVGLVTTAGDMARLLQAIHRGGSSDIGARVWSEDLNRTLTSRRATHDASMAGRSLALVETQVAGRAVWKLDGLANGFSASLTIAPDLGLAVFIAANAGTFRGFSDLSPAGELVRGFSLDMIQALFPAPPPPVQARNIAPDDRADFGGVYHTATIDRDTPLKFLRLLSSVRVEDQSDVRINVDGEPFQKVGLDLFQNGPNFVKFLRDEDGRVTHLLRPNEVFERTPLFEHDGVQRAFMYFVLAAFGIGAFVSLLGLVLRWRGARANALGLLSAGGGLALIAWFAWQAANFSVGVAYAHGVEGLPFPLWAWFSPLILAPLVFLYALFGVGIRNFNRYTLIGIALGWAAFYPVLRTWNFV